jgi:hypothetical protein
MFASAGYEMIKMEGINPTKSLRFLLFNAYFLFKSSDAKYLQFACVAKVAK